MQNILGNLLLIRPFIKAHTLYVSLHVLLVSMIFSVILMLAGALFLFNYIPDHLAVIQRAYQDQALWKLELYKLKQGVDDASAFHLLNQNKSQFDDAVYGWAKLQEDTALAQAFQQLQIAHQQFAQVRVAHHPQATILAKGQVVVSAYDALITAAKQDVDVKQSLVALLQLVCLCLIIGICIGIMLTSWRVLISRLDKMIATMPKEVVADAQRYQYEDEFERLEKSTAELSARLEGILAETTWLTKTSTEKMRKMRLSQDFLLKLAHLVSRSGLRELTIKKLLYSLECTLGVRNVALVFSDSGSHITAQRALFSSYWPTTFDEAMFDEALNTSVVSRVTKLIQAEHVQCVSMPLQGPSSCLGILIVEAEANHYFEDTELQLFEVTAHMLILSMGFQAREQEGRRVALLEERAVIARELHDSLAQSLSYMKFQLAHLQSGYAEQLQAGGFKGIVDEMREGLDHAYRELRELLTTFRVQMDIRGLDHVLDEAIQEFSQRSSLSITLDNRLQECRLTVNEEFHLLHVVREALSNIVRHSGAAKATIALVLQSAGEVMVTIDDDGKGCTFDEAKPHHYGLAIMTERAYCLGGKIEIIPRRHGGTRVRLLFKPQYT